MTETGEETPHCKGGWSAPDTTAGRVTVTTTEVSDRHVKETDQLTKTIGDLNITLRGLTSFLEQQGRLTPIPTADQLASMTKQQMFDAQLQRGTDLRELFGRVDPEVEKSRWIDSEHEQDFFQRFQPNAEPYFYARIEDTEERARWDARWRLARAATYKNLLSGRADKLTENADLVSLTTEQMEILYNIQGARYALGWYVGAFVRGDKVIEEDKIVGGKKLLECTRGKDFEEFRKLLRRELQRDIFGVTPDQREAMTPVERASLDMKVKSADAIAWNWIYCSNLAESLDSRYSIIEGERHDHLAPAICSDDLRAVFHPQEKFENKSQNGQEWGVYGRWGVIQMERIKREHRGEIVFEAASRGKDFWGAKEGDGRVVVMAPECYPTTTLRSFLEEYEEGDNGPTLFDKLLSGEEIDWSKVMADPWKTSYQTVKMVKAVGLFQHFKEPDDRAPWLKNLLDYYVRLHLKKQLGQKDRSEGVREGTSFHNLKVWAVWAAKGGVGRPQGRRFTNSWTKSKITPNIKDQRTFEILLRKSQEGFYLEKGETLDPWDR